MPRATRARDGRRDRSRAARHRLPARHRRSARLPSRQPERRATASSRLIELRKGLTALALLFLAAHLPSLPPTLEDLDSINFAMGVRDFDVAHHQPHPPGYPLFIALGKLATPVFRAAGVSAPEVWGLAVWSAIAGSLLVWLVYLFWRRFDGDDRRVGDYGDPDGMLPAVLVHRAPAPERYDRTGIYGCRARGDRGCGRPGAHEPRSARPLARDRCAAWLDCRWDSDRSRRC